MGIYNVRFHIKILLILAFFLILPSVLFAKKMEEAVDLEQTKDIKESKPKREPLQIQPVPRRDIPTFRSTDVLPLFAKQLDLKPEETPLPFSIVLFGNYFQGTVVASNFAGSLIIANGTPIPLPGGGLPPFFSMKEVSVSSIKQRFLTGGIRVAVNVLPFLSVYGLFANSNGVTETSMDITMGILGRDVIISTPFSLDFDATTAGIGGTITIGTDLFFLSLDGNYTLTTIENISALIHTVNASTRVGMHKTVGTSSLALWVGGNYMSTIGGSGKLGAMLSVERLNDLMPGIPVVGELPAQIAWSVDQEPLSVFSAILGFRYSPFKNLDFITEITFIDRITATVSLGFNF